MKRIPLILILATTFLMIWSCTDDDTQEMRESAEIKESDLLQGGDLILNPYNGVSHNGRWLVFRSQYHLEKNYKYLDTSISRYVDTRPEPTNETDYVEPNPILASFERYFRHSSLRNKMEREEHEELLRGKEPNRILNGLDDRGIADDIDASFLNVDGIVQVGSKIYYHLNDNMVIEILNSNVRAVDALLDRGLAAVYDTRYFNDINVHNTTTATSGNPAGGESYDCDGYMELAAQDYNSSTQKYDAIFTYATLPSSDITPDTREFTWNFGDGSDPVTTDDATGVTHTYDTHGTYNVSVTVIGYAGGTQVCTLTKNENFTIEPPATGECDASFVYSSSGEIGGPIVTTFEWSQAEQLGEYADLELTWNFGDGQTETSSNGNIQHTYTTGGTYQVCLTVNAMHTPDGQATYSCVTQQCMSVTANGTTPPLDLCASIEAAIETATIINPGATWDALLSGGGTPGNPDQICIGISGLEAFIGAGSVLAQFTDYIENIDAGDISWNFEGQAAEGSVACFDVSCGGSYSGSVEIEGCLEVFFQYNKIITGCVSQDVNTGWQDHYYTSGGNDKKIEYRLKTKSDTGLWQNNKVIAKMRNYKQKNNGGWKKEKADLRIELSGEVFTTGYDNCFCTYAVDVSAESQCNNSKTHEYKKNLGEQVGGIAVKDGEPWSATFRNLSTGGQVTGTANQ